MNDVLDGMSLVEARYSRGAMWFHWIIASLIIVNLLLGFFHDDFGKAVSHVAIFWHKSIGLSILVLSFGRLIWRLAHRPPDFDPIMPRWEALMAKVGHWSFYVLMIVLPLSGWIMVSAGPRPTSFFGLFNVPGLPVSQGRATHEWWESTHSLLGYAMLVLLVLHVAGALKHLYEGHGHWIGRMAPWIAPRRPALPPGA
jgi:cytochrome b561